MRRSQPVDPNGDRRGHIKDVISIRQRPAAVEDRAEPGHSSDAPPARSNSIRHRSGCWQAVQRGFYEQCQLFERYKAGKALRTGRRLRE